MSNDTTVGASWPDAMVAMQTEHSTIRIDPIPGVIGAHVSGVDLRDPLDLSALALLKTALATHQVLFFRGQDLSADQHLAFGAQFGELTADPVAILKGDLRRISYIEDTQERPPAEFPWHTDLSWLSTPPAFGILNAREIPGSGGDTIWVDLFSVYDALPPATKRQARRLKLRHRPQPHYFETVRAHHGDEITDRLIAQHPPIEHPLVRTHPVSGRPALYMCPLYADGLVGLSPEESASLLALCEEHLENPAFQVRWQWQEHDLVIWDEASTNHRALGDHYPARRRMQRCSVAGSLPFFREDS